MVNESAIPSAQEPIAPPSLIDVDPPKDEVKPAPAADDKKTDPPDAAAPPEAKVETPEQKEQKELSRRQRARLRDATRIASLETENRILREQGQRQQTPAQVEPGAPQRDKFDDYETYIEARADWRAEQKANAVIQADRETREATERQQRQSADQQRAGQEWVKREQAFQKNTKDYEAVVVPFVEEELGAFSNDARALMIESEVGPNILYFLAHTDNAEEAERIAKLSPRRQIIEIGKLEDKLKTPAVRTTKAPAPLQVVKGGKSAATDFDDNMSGEEFASWAEKNGSRVFRKRS